MGRLNKSQFVFRRDENIGAEGAEQDNEYLGDCFYDRGDLGRLRDTTTPTCLVVGRTGTGKTALLKKLRDDEAHVIELDPDGLSLHYLADSSILRRLETLGVNLSLFYKLLWRHVLAVELIKAKYGMRTEEETRSFFSSIWSLVSRDRAKDGAMKYLVEWGKTFWENTEYRVKEVTSKLESAVKASVGAKLASVLEVSASGDEKLTVEEKGEVVKHAQQAVNSIQIRELTTVIKTLAEDVFKQLQPRFHIAVDRLDENWVADPLRYRLIKALIETAREINNQLQSVKVLVAIRRDLFDRVIQETREPGFQEEKYTPSILNLRWTKDELFGLLNRRINKLVRRQYTQEPVEWPAILPAKVQGQPTDDYLIERTMYRPRDLIVFFNFCIVQAVDRPEITARMIVQAEGEYSQERLRSLRDEWDVDYPEMLECIDLLKKLPPRFRVHALTDESVSDLCLRMAINVTRRRGVISAWAAELSDTKLSPTEVRARLVCVLYRVGMVGLKLETFTSDIWSFLHAPVVTEDQIREDTGVVICPIFYRALGINPDGHEE